MLRFTLTDNDQINIFGSENVKNWRDFVPSLVRSESYRGRVRKITNAFEFIGNIRTRMIQLLDEYGTNAKSTLKIEIGNENSEEFSYSQLGGGLPLKALFPSLVIPELTANINFADSEFQENISNNEKEKLNITLATTLQGTTATDYTTLLKDIWMPDRILEFNSKTLFAEEDSGLLPDTAFFCHGINYLLNSIVSFKADDNVKNVNAETNIDKNNPLAEQFIYLKSDKKRTLNINLNLVLIGVEVFGLAVWFEIWRYSGGDDYILEEVIDLGTYQLQDFPTKNYLNIDYSININEGDSLILIAESGIANIYSYYKESSITFNSKEYFDPTISKAILPHEFFTHYIELMTGRKNAFYSDYFGRTELGYAEDGEGAYISIMNGHMLRNLNIEEHPLNTAFKDVLEDFIKLKNLTGQIEYKGDTEVFRIEKYSDTFNQQTVLNIGEIYSEVERSIDEDLTYSSISVGSKEVDLEDVFGLSSPHGELNYSTPLVGVDNQLDILLKSVLNDYAIESQRRAQQDVVSPTEDKKFDKNIILVDSKKGYTTDLIAKTNEGYDIITGVLSPDKMFNVSLTPAQQVREWGNVIRGCLTKVTDRDLILTKSATNNTLVTQKTGEDSISEKDDIPINKLSLPLMLNEKFNIEDTTLEKEQWDSLENNSNGILQFSNRDFYFYGYLNLGDFNFAEGKGSFELIKANR